MQKKQKQVQQTKSANKNATNQKMQQTKKCNKQTNVTNIEGDFF